MEGDRRRDENAAVIRRILIGRALRSFADGFIAVVLPAALLMAATGVAFAGSSAFWPLLVVAFFGTLNPSSGDASVFMPLDHTMLATASDRTGVFARYSFLGSISGAVGALCAGLPEWLGARLSMLEALRLMFVLYAAVGVMV